MKFVMYQVLLIALVAFSVTEVAGRPFWKRFVPKFLTRSPSPEVPPPPPPVPVQAAPRILKGGNRGYHENEVYGNTVRKPIDVRPTQASHDRRVRFDADVSTKEVEPKRKVKVPWKSMSRSKRIKEDDWTRAAVHEYGKYKPNAFNHLVDHEQHTLRGTYGDMDMDVDEEEEFYRNEAKKNVQHQVLAYDKAQVLHDDIQQDKFYQKNPWVGELQDNYNPIRHYYTDLVPNTFNKKVKRIYDKGL